MLKPNHDDQDMSFFGTDNRGGSRRWTTVEKQSARENFAH